MKRCGIKMYNGFEMPLTAEVKQTVFDSRPYYISGIYDNEVTLRYLDTGEFEKVNFKTFSRHGR